MTDFVQYKLLENAPYSTCLKRKPGKYNLFVSEWHREDKYTTAK